MIISLQTALLSMIEIGQLLRLYATAGMAIALVLFARHLCTTHGHPFLAWIMDVCLFVVFFLVGFSTGLAAYLYLFT